ncbi:MAG: type VI secretion system domain-containing protein, partial [Gemmatimonadetes bacterium]|nr:type VI secretion system domain-containing protein [Gemmatimonadota bacterium]
GMNGIEPQLLEAPTPDDRRRLRGHFLDEQWEDLLEASEEVMASEAGRGWLDLQRYSILAADKLGKDYHPVGATLRGALTSLLDDLPALVSATLMDDSAATSSETLAWLTAAGFVQVEEEGEVQPDPGDDTDPDRVRREGRFDRAQKLVQGGDPDGAIRLLMRRADRERSERARFLTRVEAAAIMVGRGELNVARPILDELLQKVDGHNLDEWEAGEMVARPLGLLYRCLDPDEGPLRQQIYQRICRLDPLLARSIGEAKHG